MTLEKVERYLKEKEKKIDEAVRLRREIVRLAAQAVKDIHTKNLKEAKRKVREAKALLKRFPKEPYTFSSYLHVCQEVFEAEILLSAVEKKTLPQPKKPYEAFLTGMLDAIGEIKREMYEALRKGKRREAERYFSLMENAYDELLPFKYADSVLPEFRRKQDIARIQLEQARGELL